MRWQRWRVTSETEETLLAELILTPYPTRRTQTELAERLHVTRRRVRVWFQNQRQRREMRLFWARIVALAVPLVLPAARAREAARLISCLDDAEVAMLADAAAEELMRSARDVRCAAADVARACLW